MINTDHFSKIDHAENGIDPKDNQWKILLGWVSTTLYVYTLAELS